MSEKRVTIRQKNAYSAEIIINGVDLANIVSAYHIQGSVEDGPQVVIQFSPAVLPEFDGPAELEVTHDLHEALLHLGWAPPPTAGMIEYEVSTLGGPERVFLRSNGTYRTEPWHTPGVDVYAEPPNPLDPSQWDDGNGTPGGSVSP